MGLLGVSLIAVLLSVGLMFGPKLLRKQFKGEVRGSFKPGYGVLYKAFQKNFDDGQELGAAFALFHKGKMMVEMYSGLSNSHLHRAWEKDTLAPLLYATNLLPVLSISLLEQRGDVDYDQKISRYWPEFGTNGKENITLGNLLSHQAGLAAFESKISEEDVKDPKKMAVILAAMKPSWEIGKNHGFHYVTLGWILAEVIRRSDSRGRSSGAFFKEEIGNPIESLHNKDHHVCLHLGLDLDEQEQNKVALTYSPGYLDLWESMAEEPTLAWTRFKQHANHKCPEDDLPGSMHDASWHNFPENRKFDVPTVNGFATARGAARLMSYVISGWNGVDTRVEKLLNLDPEMEITAPRFSNETILKLLTPLVNGTDKVLQEETAFSLGCFVKENPLGQPIFGMPGGGGIMVMADPINQLAWAYIPTRLTPHKVNDLRYLRLEKSIYESEIGLATDRDYTHLLKKRREQEKITSQRVEMPSISRKEEL